LIFYQIENGLINQMRLALDAKGLEIHQQYWLYRK